MPVTSVIASSREAVAASPALRADRLTSIDVVRGVVMVLMAIDHVRVYAGLPAGGPTPGIFFTRWVTHFCAPAFAFLAGTAVFFHGRKLADKAVLARYLVTRGLVLVALELTLIRLAWSFDLDFSHMLAGVIWMLGWCMVLMAGLVRFSARAVGITGLIVIFAQDVMGRIPSALPPALRDATGWLWQFLYLGGEVPLGANGPTITVLYVIVPWIGVMAAGYGFGAVLTGEPEERRRLCLRIGLFATAFFVVIAGLVVAFGDAPEGAPPALFRLLNQRKYPASQLFLLMTLGPVIALLPFAERMRGPLGRLLAVFGRVPMFYYLLHIPLIHISALVVNLLRTGHTSAAAYSSAPYVSLPESERWSLPLLYLVWLIDVAILYVPCRWFAALKSRRSSPWLSYI
jgi:uncharacterized membrane protein